MELAIYSPTGEILTQKIIKVSFETPHGYYTLLPRHVDFVSALRAGIITYVTDEKQERYAACHQGLIVKKGTQVTISSQSVLLADSLEELKKIIAGEFKQIDEEHKELNAAMARLELGLMRGVNFLGGQ